MKIAFDYGGVLANSDFLCEVAIVLSNCNHSVSVISALGIHDVEKVKADLASKGLGHLSFYPVYLGYAPFPPDAFAGRGKLEVMQKEGISLLIDDNPTICKVVREGGLKAILVNV